MQTHQIKRTHKLKKSKQIARGGRRGKQAGRGGKGQTARAGAKVRPALRDEIKKLPKLRGHGINRSHTVVYKDPKRFAIVNLGSLNIFEDGEVVNPISLVAKGLVSLRHGKMPVVKILAKGELIKKVKIENCKVSKVAEEKLK
jgi:large subunit ribosomal protein L15